MITKYNLEDVVETKDFKGVISMITITRKGVRYRAYGERTYSSGCVVPNSQDDFMEDEIIRKL